MKKAKNIFSILIVMSLFLAIIPNPIFISASAAENTDIVRYAVLILDTSGSMSGTPAMIQKQAAIKFCTTLLRSSGKNYVGIVKLNTSSSIGLEFTDSIGELSEYIQHIPADGGTNIEEALSVAGNMMDEIDVPSNTTVIKNIVLCSDGVPERGKESTDGPFTSNDSQYYKFANGAYQTAERLKSTCNLYSLGFFHSLSGSELQFGQKLMEQLQNSGNYVVTNPDELEFTFGEIAEDITQSVLRRKFIEEHAEYAKSEEYSDYIIRGYGPHMKEVLNDVTSDTGIKAYKFFSSFSDVISLNLDFDETKEYELLLAQVLFNSVGKDKNSLLKEAIESNFTVFFSDALLTCAGIIADTSDFVSVVGEDSRNSLKDIIRTMAFQDPHSPEYGKNAAKLFDFLNGYDNLDIHALFTGKELVKKLKGSGLDFAVGLAVDELQAICDSADKLCIYLAAGQAYSQTSDAFASIILAMRQQIAYGSKRDTDEIFLPIKGHGLVYESMLYNALGISGTISPVDVDPNKPIHINQLCHALENFYNGIMNYKEGNIKEIADECVQDYIDGQSQIWIKNGASAVLQLGGCLPVIREYQAIKTVVTGGKFFIDITSDIDDRAYNGTCIMRLFCLSYILYPVLEDLRIIQRSYGSSTNDALSSIPGIPTIEERQFAVAVQFDEAINIYRSIVAVASDYGIEYEQQRLNAENSKLFPSAEKTSWYSSAVCLAATQKFICQNDIKCHSDELNYDPNTGKVTFDGNLKVCTFACPVDVTISTDSGKQIAYLSNSGSTITEGYEKYFFTFESENDPNDYVKLAVVPESYKVTIDGSDTGTMNAYVANYINGEITEAGGFYNVPITDETEGYIEHSSNDSGVDVLVINGETITAVDGGVHVSGITLNKSDITLTSIGGTEHIVASVMPSNAGNQIISWKSDDDTVATVDDNGIVTAISGGTTTITATTDDGSFSATCTVTVDVCEISFDACGGTSVSSVIIPQGGKLSNLPTTSKSNYDFIGWYTKADGGKQVTVDTVFTSDATIYAHWSYVGGGGNGGGGGSSVTYRINISSNMTGGSIQSSARTSQSGSRITITVTPDDGYKLDSLVVKNERNKEIALTDKGNGRYTFTMPASDVNVSANFISEVYRIKVSQSPYGTVNANVSTASSGTIISITVSPDTGYEMSDYTVCDSSGNVLFHPSDISFIMPTEDIIIVPVFSKIRNPFSDVYPGAYYDAIIWAYGNNVTLGVTATTFVPNGTCTRAQAVTFLWRAAGSPEPVSNRNPFVDVPSSAYYYKAVIWAVEQGITTGRTISRFAPNEAVSRANVVTFLYRMSGANTNSYRTTFHDVKANAYYSEAVSWAAVNGIARGFSDSTFHPNDSCTRGQIVTFLYRYFV